MTQAKAARENEEFHLEVAGAFAERALEQAEVEVEYARYWKFEKEHYLEVVAEALAERALEQAEEEVGLAEEEAENALERAMEERP